ncbi:uncharacterized protein LOC133179425 [Saccostrea echinata]|uniref:uncharacterized protein LOC133179425 n=1 Tax=Saccostrea echinata TaxID=191078 RepID=UPI002A7FB44C|nr:uncharacterized protein LOC133179425 [Saccostrea echinata]
MISGGIFLTAFLFIECVLCANTTQGVTTAQLVTEFVNPTIQPGRNCSNAAYCFVRFNSRVTADPSNKIFVCSELQTLVSCLRGVIEFCDEGDSIKGSDRYVIMKALADSCRCTSGSSGSISKFRLWNALHLLLGIVVLGL